MPLYEYKCRGCGHQYEALVRGGEVPPCPSCKGQDLERLLSAFGMTSKEHTQSLVRAERKRFVYEALRSTADATQRPLLARLAGARARFQAFYLVNMVAVEADRPLAEELASRDDVALVAANRPRSPDAWSATGHSSSNGTAALSRL